MCKIHSSEPKLGGKYVLQPFVLGKDLRVNMSCKTTILNRKKILLLTKKKIKMPKPESVNPEKFKVIRILFNHNDFAVSYGTWTPNKAKVIAMRYNDGDDGAGYPKVFGHPQWFIVSEDISKNILTGLLNNPLLTTDEYLHILEVLKTI
jgi:hypothetical protein